MEDRIGQEHFQEMETLHRQMQEKERCYTSRLQEKEHLFQSLSKEIDSLVSTLGHGTESQVLIIANISGCCFSSLSLIKLFHRYYW